MATATSQPTRRLQVTACELITSGVTNDRQWRLYRIQAVDRQGRPIDQKLTSFDELQPGLVDDFIVTPKVSDRYGVSYQLRRRRGQLGGRVDQLEQQAADHEKRLAALEASPPF